MTPNLAFDIAPHAGLITRITATSPNRLTKRIGLGFDGRPENESGGNLVRGHAEILQVSGVRELSTIIAALKPAQAFTFGIPRGGVGGSIACRDAANPGELTRTRDRFKWPAGPGFMLLDYDPAPEGEPLDPATLRTRLIEVAPALAAAPIVIIASASGYIYHRETGAMLRGQRGLHVYVHVADARDIPRTGQALNDRLWLAGHGRIAISSAGSLLERTIVDTAVWQPERLDFAAGALCVAPLEQRRPAPVLWNPDAAPLDTVQAVPDIADKRLRKDLQAIKKASKDAASGLADGAIGDWIERRIEKDKAEASVPLEETELQGLRAHYRRCVESSVLFGDFKLHCVDGTWVSVRELLEGRQRWHGARFADPLEPDYHQDNRIAWANLQSGGKPYIWSHAHGGRRFVLEGRHHVVTVVPGEMPRIIGEALKVLAEVGEVFQRGGELVRVADGRIIAVTEPWLRTHLEKEISFRQFGKKGLVPTDCPKELQRRILHARGAWPFPELRGLQMAPTLRPDGSILNEPGYDQATGLLLLSDSPDSWPAIIENPSSDEIRDALRRLWEPLSTFPYVEPLDRAGVLAAALTACIRPNLPTAPAFLVKAHSPGTGKTKLATALAALTGVSAAVTPWARTGEEQRKALLAGLLDGSQVLLIDNVVGSVDSAELCAMLTAESYEDRRLGVSERVRVSTKVLVLATGNNVTLVGDLGRRFVAIRLDQGVEHPEQLEFPFDPVEVLRENWLSLRCDALTVLRGFICAGTPRNGAGAVGSFDVWDRSIRQCVLWLDQSGHAEAAGLEALADPFDAIARNLDEDPERNKLSALLAAWYAAFADLPMTVAKVIAEANAGRWEDDTARSAVLAPLEEIAGEGGRINPRRLGRWLERNAGRIIDGTCFKQGQKYCGSWRWFVEVKRSSSDGR